jgi:hypothetical protein
MLIYEHLVEKEIDYLPETLSINDITIEKLRSFKEFKLELIAIIFGFGLTRLKRDIKNLGIRSWPSRLYRRFRVIERYKHKLSVRGQNVFDLITSYDILSNGGTLPSYYQDELNYLYSLRRKFDNC